MVKLWQENTVRKHTDGGIPTQEMEEKRNENIYVVEGLTKNEKKGKH